MGHISLLLCLPLYFFLLGFEKTAPSPSAYGLASHRESPSLVSIAGELWSLPSLSWGVPSLSWACDLHVRRFSGACNLLSPLVSVCVTAGSLVLQRAAAFGGPWAPGVQMCQFYQHLAGQKVRNQSLGLPASLLMEKHRSGPYDQLC